LLQARQCAERKRPLRRLAGAPWLEHLVDRLRDGADMPDRKRCPQGAESGYNALLSVPACPAGCRRAKRPLEGLIWGSTCADAGSVGITMSSAGFIRLRASLPALHSNSEASRVKGTGNGSGGRGRTGSQGATSAVGLASDPVAAGGAGDAALGPSGTEALAAPQGVDSAYECIFNRYRVGRSSDHRSRHE